MIKMKYNLKEYSTEEDYNSLMKELKSTDFTKLTQENIDELHFMMCHTEYTGLRDRIAILIAKTRNEAILISLIALIKQNINTKFIGSLIYACIHFDCSKYIELFVDIIMVKDDSTGVDAYLVIKAIKSPIDPNIKTYCVNKLTALSELLDEEYRQYKSVRQTIELINSLD